MPRRRIVPILACAVLLAASQSGSAVRPGKNPGALAFIGSNGRGVVQVIDRPGAAPRELPAPPGSAQRVAWSRDGSRLAFTHVGTGVLSDGVYVVDRSGRHERAMSSLPVAGRSMTFLASPSWSPDGREVVFTGNEPVSVYGVAQQSDLFVATSDGKALRVLTALPGEEAYPTWSPDGSRILFSYNPLLCCGLALWTVPSTGGPPQPFGPAGWLGGSPSWSPSGDRVAFVGGPVNEPAALWVVRADGSRPVRIGDYHALDFLTPPVWSPDGRWLAWPCS
ncbi:MAG TPA: hypothetical protein VM347_11985, partial [Nonomuraea sp.]|nr:hypothetical protein [Nonomuraea sp.]